MYRSARRLHTLRILRNNTRMKPIAAAAEREKQTGWLDQLHVSVAGPLRTKPLAGLLEGDTSILPEGQGGTPVWQLVSDLVQRGQCVSAVTLDTAANQSVVAAGPRLRVIYGPYRARHRMRDLMAVERRAVRDGLAQLQPDLVHAHWCYEYALGALASGLPTLITVRDWAPTIVRLMDAKYRPYWTGRAVMYFVTLARGRFLTAPSPYIAKRIRRFTRGAIEVVSNGLADELFSRSQSGSDSDDRPRALHPVLLSVNNGFSPFKNVHRLLEAVRAVRQRGVDCELHLAGVDYAAGERCEVWARQRRLADGVRFLGPLSRDEVLTRMRDAAVLVHPSREESFGMTLVEAMAQGTPVIAGARSGAVPWVLDGGKAGVLVDVEDPRAIANAISDLLASSPRREQLATAGYRHAWTNFRQSQVTDQFLGIYRRVLSENGRQ